MSLPTPYTLQFRVFAAGAVDAHNNPVDSWGDPVDWPVHGYAPGANAEPHDSNRDLSVVLWTVYSPHGDLNPSVRDLVILGGVEYAVEGEPRDYWADPFSHHIGGVAVYLRKPEG